MPDAAATPERATSVAQRRAAARTAVVWDALVAAVPAEGGLRVVDIGGGTGGLAVRLAEQGHQVTVVDPSPDALAALDRRAREQDVAARVVGRQGDLADLPRLVPEGGADLVLCHGVLEIVRDPEAALDTLRESLAGSGLLSLLLAQRHAAVVGRALAGHLGQALALLEGSPAPETDPVRGALHRFTVPEVRDLLPAHGLRVRSVHGVRVFADLVPGSLLDLEAGASEALLRLERVVAEREEYLSLANQLHVLADPA